MIQLLGFLRRLERLRGYDAARAKRRAGLLRVFAFGGAVSVAASTCALPSVARADLSEASMGVGAQMMEFADLLRAPRSVSINGERMMVSSGVSKDDVKGTLDRFEAHCRAREGVTGELWRQITGANGDGAALPEGSPLSLMRREDARSGLVMCLVRPAGRPARSLLGAVSEFARTHDLGALGALRYAYARRSKGGTSVVTAWTDDRFDLDAMFPRDGADAPGTDSAYAPAPPGATRRLLAARIEGTPYGVRVYQSSAAPDAIYAAYAKAMAERGFTPLGAADTAEDPSAGVGFLKDGLLVAVSAGPDPKGGSVVTVGDLGGGTTERPTPPR